MHVKLHQYKSFISSRQWEESRYRRFLHWHSLAAQLSLQSLAAQLSVQSLAAQLSVHSYWVHRMACWKKHLKSFCQVSNLNLRHNSKLPSVDRPGTVFALDLFATAFRQDLRLLRKQIPQRRVQSFEPMARLKLLIVDFDLEIAHSQFVAPKLHPWVHHYWTRKNHSVLWPLTLRFLCPMVE